MLASGALNRKKNGEGNHLNFILSNGARTEQKDAKETYHDHMMPADAHLRVRSISIYNCIFGPIVYVVGFSFFDKDGVLILKIGYTNN